MKNLEKEPVVKILELNEEYRLIPELYKIKRVKKFKKKYNLTNIKLAYNSVEGGHIFKDDSRYYFEKETFISFMFLDTYTYLVINNQDWREEIGKGKLEDKYSKIKAKYPNKITNLEDIYANFYINFFNIKTGNKGIQYIEIPKDIVQVTYNNFKYFKFLNLFKDLKYKKFKIVLSNNVEDYFYSGEDILLFNVFKTFSLVINKNFYDYDYIRFKSDKKIVNLSTPDNKTLKKFLIQSFGEDMISHYEIIQPPSLKIKSIFDVF